MKKIILGVFCCLLVSVIATGCTYKTNYIKKYNDELHTIFGDFSYDYLGEEYDHGYDGLGRHNYKKWQIHFTDSYGKEESATLVNDKKIDTQIVSIYKYYVKRRLTTEILNKYFNYDYDDILNTSSNDYGYTTQKYNYRISINFSFNLTDYYDSREEKIKDYKFFDLTNTNINELINKEIVNISEIKYIPLDERILNESELNLELNYLTETTKEINDIVPIKIAYYWLYENKIDYEGKSYIGTTENELNFK